LREYGYRWFCLDLSDGPAGRLPELQQLIEGCQEARAERPYALFNFERRPW